MAQLVKTVNGLAIASVKTVNGLAIASVKTIAGLDNTAAGGSVTAGNRTQNASFSGTSGTITSYVNSNVSPMVVEIVTASGTSDQCTGVTWNGSENLTRLDSRVVSSGVGRTYMYGLKNPTATTANIVAGFSGSVTGMLAVVGTVGGDTTTGFRTVYSRANADGTGPGLTVVDSVSGDLVVHGVGVFANSITWDAGETTTNTTTDNFGGNSMSGGLSTKPAVGANTVVGATDVALYGEIAVAVRP